VRAASNPFVTIIGHMTGRQLLRRPGYELDIERVLSACAEQDVAVEVNGNPWRLDLDWRWLRRGLDLGCKFSINPDAHATREIASSTRWGWRSPARAAYRRAASSTRSIWTHSPCGLIQGRRERGRRTRRRRASARKPLRPPSSA
jgi:DNA polymerase (family 10)